LRTVPSASTTPALYVQAPVLALIWGLIVVPLSWRYRRLRAGALTALIVLAGLLVLIMSPGAPYSLSGVWSLLPSFYKQVGFAYRLQTYVTLACAGLVLVGALALTRRAESGRATRLDRPLALGLGLAVAFGVALSAWQLWVPNTHITAPTFSTYSIRAEALRAAPTFLPQSWDWSGYEDGSLPVLTTTGEFTFDPVDVDNDRLTTLASFPPGLQPVATNISGGPYLVHVGGGVRVVGRTERGFLVLQRKTNGSQPVPVELSTRLSASALLGRIITAAAAALLLALAFLAAVRRLRRRSGART